MHFLRLISNICVHVNLWKNNWSNWRLLTRLNFCCDHVMLAYRIIIVIKFEIFVSSTSDLS